MLLHLIKKEDIPMEKDSAFDSSLSKFIFYILILYLANSLKSKIKFVTLMMKVMRTLREENELIVKLKGLCPGNKIPRGVILQGPSALKTAFEKYKNAKNLDSINEKHPDLIIEDKQDYKEIKDKDKIIKISKK